MANAGHSNTFHIASTRPVYSADTRLKYYVFKYAKPLIDNNISNLI